MSETYNPQRTRNLYDPRSKTPFKLSRSKIDLYQKCPRCFYLDRRLGIAQPSGPAFTLNSAVGVLLAKEFDAHRRAGTPHPLMEKYGVKAVPAPHPQLAIWRQSSKGVQFLHPPTNFLVTGAIDDLWVDSQGAHFIVDYKSTAKAGDVTELNSEWHEGYKRQLEVYQWLVRKNGLTVSNTGYFVYANGRANRDGFNGRLDFDLTLIPYAGSSDWVEKTLKDIFQCLKAPQPPPSSETCDFCAYTQAVLKYPTKNR